MVPFRVGGPNWWFDSLVVPRLESFGVVDQGVETRGLILKDFRFLIVYPERNEIIRKASRKVQR